MSPRLRRVAMSLLGALLLGTVGLSLGSWFGGRGVTPPTYAQARDVAGKVLPNASPSNTDQVVPGSRWGVGFAADDVGSGRTTFWYTSADDCALSKQAGHNIAAQGWHGISRTTGYLCDNWSATRDGVTVALEHSASGVQLDVGPEPPAGFTAFTIAGTLLGAATGVVLFWLVSRRQPPAPLLVGTLVTVGLLPGVTFTWNVLVDGPDLRTEPVWPIWPALAPLLVPLWLALLCLGFYGRRALPPSPGSNRTVVVVAVAWLLGVVATMAALILLFLLAQPTRPDV
ncbi:hypothetical protein ACQPZK_30380 [Micromonospora sp. CA-249363]|uniref:hypothetical protein n=1 Tax=Micromonospora sp. CA-249363 TaxID=3239963 RepID=UPI003D8DA816